MELRETYRMATIREALDSLSDKNIKHIVSLSGGKDSTALAIYMKRQYPDIPVEYVFCDTGCELPETYEYLERLEALLGVKVRRIDALDLKGIEKKPTRIPFDYYLNQFYGGFLPNPRSRWCTRVLKIEPFEKYVGEGYAFSYIGIRADEDRDGYQAKKPPVISQRPNIVPVYPFKDDGIGLVDVKQILEESGLGVPAYYKWRSRSGCYFCFYQQRGEWQRLKENHPDLFEKAKTYEKTNGEKRFTWVQGKSLDDIANLPKKYPLLDPEEAEGCAICHL
jgi:3'-phosphoadenosine 5'-phosphosulfate sulfotransferase (PAPS reductase)/FAD synthetase